MRGGLPLPDSPEHPEHSPEEEGTGALAQHVVGEHVPELPGHVAHEPQHWVAPLGGGRSKAISGGGGGPGPPHPAPPQGRPPTAAPLLPTLLLLNTWGSPALLSSSPQTPPPLPGMF